MGSWQRTECRGLGAGWKEFPDMRQNEKEIKFTRVGDTVGTAGQLKGGPKWTGVLSPLLYPGYKEWDQSLVGHLLIRWGMYTGWGKIRANTFSLWGRRGERWYTGQEDLKFINSYNTGYGREGRLGSGFSVPAFQDPTWFSLLFHPWVTTLNIYQVTSV